MNFYRQHGRTDLPWRKRTRTPYHVLVSEIMLQQTQVERVIEFYTTWMRVFPNFRALATAPQLMVLRHWKGLGYNSRALRLHQLAKIVVEKYKGKLPNTREELEGLPGIGPYTAGAILVFAFNKDGEVFIETNIRRVYIHHFFPKKKKVTDKEILDLVSQTLPDPKKIDSFTWYSALMDYGSTLPKILKRNPNTKSKGYTKQTTFKGSNRQIRGAILDILLEKPATLSTIQKKLEVKILYKPETDRVKNILKTLEKEGFIIDIKGKYRLR